MSEPPIQNLGVVDICAKRKSGGADLFVVVSSYLDGSLPIQKLLKDKLQVYVDTLRDPEFIAEFGAPNPAHTRVVVSCADEPAEEIRLLIQALTPFFAENGAALSCEVRPPR